MCFGQATAMPYRNWRTQQRGLRVGYSVKSSDFWKKRFILEYLSRPFED